MNSSLKNFSKTNISFENRKREVSKNLDHLLYVGPKAVHDIPLMMELCLVCLEADLHLVLDLDLWLDQWLCQLIVRLHLW